MELLGCTGVIQTLCEISRPAHLPWQLARLGRCVLAVDKSGGESWVDRAHSSSSGEQREWKKRGNLSQMCVSFSMLWSYSYVWDSISLSQSYPLYFYIHSSAFHSPCLFLPFCLFFSPAFSSCWEMTQLGCHG